MQMRGIGERVVTPDGEHGVDFECLENPQHMRRAINGAFCTRAKFILEEIRQTVWLSATRVGARGVQDSAPAAVDGANALRIERHDVVLAAFWIVGIIVQRPGPAALEPNHIPSARNGGARDRLDAGIESRNIAAASQNTDPHDRSLTRRTHREFDSHPSFGSSFLQASISPRTASAEFISAVCSSA